MAKLAAVERPETWAMASVAYCQASITAMQPLRSFFTVCRRSPPQTVDRSSPRWEPAIEPLGPLPAAAAQPLAVNHRPHQYRRGPTADHALRMPAGDALRGNPAAGQQATEPIPQPANLRLPAAAVLAGQVSLSSGLGPAAAATGDSAILLGLKTAPMRSVGAARSIHRNRHSALTATAAPPE